MTGLRESHARVISHSSLPSALCLARPQPSYFRLLIFPFLSRGLSGLATVANAYRSSSEGPSLDRPIKGAEQDMRELQQVLELYEPTTRRTRVRGEVPAS